MQHQLRQGDVLLVPVRTVPQAAVARPATNGRHVLAYGEVTGHHHSFADDGGVALLDAPETGETFLRVDAVSALLEHQEHATLTVPRGTFRVVRQREYHPAELRTVAD